MSDITLIVGGARIPIRDLGEQKINEQFKNLYSAYFSNGVFNNREFLLASHEYFDRHSKFQEHDAYFNNFIPIWLSFFQRGDIKEAKEIWLLALRVAWDWEKKMSKDIHKGTPYYFLGGSCILWKRFEKGFLLMHQAVKEDERIPNPKAPAELFVTLDYSVEAQYFREIIQKVADFLEGYLRRYSGQIDLEKLKNSFLKENELKETVFSFVYNLFRIYYVQSDIDAKLKKNDFASLLETEIVFSLCRVIENVIKKKNSTEKDLFKHILFISRKGGLTLNQIKMGQISNSFKNDFPQTLQNILNSNYTFSDGSAMSDIEKSLTIVYGFRNFGAHEIENQPLIYENFEKIVEHVMNSLFFCIEKLYLSSA